MTKSISLVVDFEKESTKEYFQPQHIKGSVALDGLELGRKLEKKGVDIGTKDIREVASFVASKMYNGQFTADDLIDGIHATELITTIMNQLSSVLGSESGNFTKAKKA